LERPLDRRRDIPGEVLVDAPAVVALPEGSRPIAEPGAPELEREDLVTPRRHPAGERGAAAEVPRRGIRAEPVTEEHRLAPRRVLGRTPAVQRDPPAVARESEVLGVSPGAS